MNANQNHCNHKRERGIPIVSLLALQVAIGLIVCTSSFAEDLIGVKEVGPVKVTTRLTPKDPIIGDEITLEITVEAEADVEVLLPEFGEALDRYTILDFVPRQKIKDDGATIFTQRYTLQPYLSGEQSIPPILVEFVDNRPGKKPAPDDLDAYEILTDRLDFEVKSVVPAGAADEMKPPLGKMQLESESKNSSSVAWIVIALILLGSAVAGGIVFYLRHKSQIARRNAYEIARSKLDQLLAGSVGSSEEEITKFFVSISTIVRRYLEDRFQLRAPDLTTEEFLELASEASDLSREHQSLLRDFLRQADMVKFAGVTASEEEVTRSTDLAIRFLEETRENAPMIEESESASEQKEAAHV